jgi:serine/threonine-protein kinase
VKDCPDVADLRRLLTGQLDEARDSAVSTHVESCPRCQKELELLTALAESADGAGDRRDGDPALARLRGLLPQTGRRAPSSAGTAGDGAVSWPDVPGYEIEDELGRGGMAVVYRARQVRLNRVVALKMAMAQSAPEHLVRFAIEGETLARLRHPHIVQIHEVGTHQGRPYFALECVWGGSLRERLAGQPLPLRQAAQLVEVVARAVQHAHEQGVVHRDLKPSNILLDSDTRALVDTRIGQAEPNTVSLLLGQEELVPKVSDFGLARRLDTDLELTRPGCVVGTPGYMAPEQAHSRYGSVGPAADVYGLGAILYECLTGRAPFVGESPLEVLRRVVDSDPVPPSLLRPECRGDLEAVCLKCLEKQPAGRYESALAVALDLRRYLEGKPTRARPVGPLVRAWRWGRRHPWEAVLVGLAAAAAVLAVGGWVWLQGQRTEALQRQARLTAEVNADLQEATRLAAQARAEKATDLRRLAEAVGVAQRASARLSAQEADGELRQRVEHVLAEIQGQESTARRLAEEAEQDRRLLPVLEHIRWGQFSWRNGALMDGYPAEPAYRKAFQEYGIDVDRLQPAAAAAAIRRRAICGELCGYVGHWMLMRKGQGGDWQRLSEVVRLADPDPWRTRIRAALVGPAPDRAVRELADEARSKDLPPTTLVLLASGLGKHHDHDRAIRLLLPAQRRYPGDERILLLLGDNYLEGGPPRPAEVLRFATAALAIRPSSTAYSQLGWALNEMGQVEEGLDHMRRAVALYPDNDMLCANLAIFLMQKGWTDRGVALFQEVARRRPVPFRYYQLGQALVCLGDMKAAEASLRKALGCEMIGAEAHTYLGCALMEQGRLDDALAHLRQGHELGKKKHRWPFPTPQWIERAQKLLRLEANLPAVLRGATPADPVTCHEYAFLCRVKHFPVAAVRLEEAVLAARTKLPLDWVRTSQFNGACSAVQAALGQGKDSAALSPEERTRLRQRALALLREALTTSERQLKPGSKTSRKVEMQLRSWHLDSSLAAVRGAALEKLPDDERPGWRKLWADLDAVLQRCEMGP